MGVLFYLRSDGQYILVGDAIMAVLFLLITMLCDVLIDNGRSLSRKENPRSIKTSRSMIINKNTAMIVSLTKICCPFDLKKKRTPTVSQNVSQYNN
jgi:hypothetical protein